MKPATAVTVMSLAICGSLFAADIVPGSALISDTAVKATDSPLVRAAKMVAAQRKGLVEHSPTVITNDTLKLTGGHISTSSSVPYAPDPGNLLPGPSDPPPPPPAGLSTADRAKIEQKIQNLQTEQRIMAHEADQPWSDEIDEGKVEQRMTQIPGEINQLQKQLNPPPKPPSNPPQQ